MRQTEIKSYIFLGASFIFAWIRRLFLFKLVIIADFGALDFSLRFGNGGIGLLGMRNMTLQNNFFVPCTHICILSKSQTKKWDGGYGVQFFQGIPIFMKKLYKQPIQVFTGECKNIKIPKGSTHFRLQNYIEITTFLIEVSTPTLYFYKNDSAPNSRKKTK